MIDRRVVWHEMEYVIVVLNVNLVVEIALKTGRIMVRLLARWCGVIRIG